MRYIWIPILIGLSVILTSVMMVNDFGPWTILLTTFSVGAGLGYITGKLGYEV